MEIKQSRWKLWLSLLYVANAFYQAQTPFGFIIDIFINKLISGLIFALIVGGIIDWLVMRNRHKKADKQLGE